MKRDEPSLHVCFRGFRGCDQQRAEDLWSGALHLQECEAWT